MRKITRTNDGRRIENDGVGYNHLAEPTPPFQPYTTGEVIW